MEDEAHTNATKQVVVFVEQKYLDALALQLLLTSIIINPINLLE